MGIYKRALGAAAIQVLAEEGNRGLTHRAVDKRAGLPEGTASRYARTRRALQELATEEMFGEDSRDAALALMEVASREPGLDAVVDLLVAVTMAFVSAPERYLARIELQLEARRTPALRRLLAQARGTFVGTLADVLQHLNHSGANDCAEVIVATIDGILHRQLVLDQTPFSNGQLRTLFVAIVGSRDAGNGAGVGGSGTKAIDAGVRRDCSG